MTAPANGRARIDLEASARAAASEADREPFLITYKGSDYDVPPQYAWPVKAMRAIGRGDFDEALPLLLGPENADQLTADGLVSGELNHLFELIAKAAGLDLGNSPALPPPSSMRK